jgi:hypothetical protein
MTCGVVNLTPVLCVVRTSKRPLLFLLWGLLAMVSVVPSVLAITPINCVDLMIFLLPWGPLASGFQESGPGFRGLYAHIDNCE